VTAKDLTAKVGSLSCGIAANAATHPVISVLVSAGKSLVSGPAPDRAVAAEIVSDSGRTTKVATSDNTYVAQIDGNVQSVTLLAADGSLLK